MVDARARVEAIVLDGDGWLQFRDPVRVFSAIRPDDVRPVIRDVERLTRDHRLHAVGWLSFEAASAYGLATHTGASRWPLAWFALFEASAVRQSATLDVGDYNLGSLTPLLDREQFRQGFQRIRDHIAAGDTYQANFTFQTESPFEGDPRALFRDLVEAQQGKYAAFLSIGDLAVCSASPELFFELDGMVVRTRPMKGTAPRGLTAESDEARRKGLVTSTKERAENVMIVDMMRNDLGRVAQIGTVEVPTIFEAERYPTVWQMTSQVTARSMASLDDIIAALHPSASVTGAPKVKTMEILAALEQEPRGIYTGAIGHVPPSGNARFNVAIRTAVVDQAASTVRFGVGSGIVWDSEADAEYDECLLKAAVLGRKPAPAFELLETLKWQPESGFLLRERHLSRMEASAGYFGIQWTMADAACALDGAVADAVGPLRVRLLLTQNGAFRVEATPLSVSAEPARVRLALAPIASNTVWVYHKTTNREVYESAKAGGGDADDVLLWNERGEVTESTVANVVIEIDGERVTPPVSCGLLAGTFRAELLAMGQVKERVVTTDELRGRQLWLVNSVREWRRAELVD